MFVSFKLYYHVLSIFVLFYTVSRHHVDSQKGQYTRHDPMWVCELIILFVLNAIHTKYSYQYKKEFQ